MSIPSVSSVLDVDGHYKALMRFIVDNGLITSIAAYTIGVAFATALKSFVSDIMMPCLYRIVYAAVWLTPFRDSNMITVFFRYTAVNIDAFIKELVNVVLILFCAYYLFTRMLAKFIDEKKARDASKRQQDQLATVAALAATLADAVE